MTPDRFVETLAATSMPRVFNPWRDRCEVYDLKDAPLRRQRNLEQVLEAIMDARSDSIWIARDLGYRGGRRTGIPLTDEVHLDQAGELLRTSSLERATEGPIVAERTAAIIWNVLQEVRRPVMLWNIFPFHPHEEGNPFSNRCHSRKEREATWHILDSLITMLRPKQIVAIGRDAQVALSEMGIESCAVRHPSYGGQTEFIAGVFSIYGIAQVIDQNSPKLPL
jgi:uracil-DNA glycosylase